MNKKLLKQCAKCGRLKEQVLFYRDRSCKDGRYPYCKICLSELHSKSYMKARDKILEQQREYRKTPGGKEKVLRNGRKMYKKYPERWIARSKARYQVKTGKLAKLACECCGNFLSEMHHPDYNKPLYVWWLCKKHHRMADKGKLDLYKERRCK